MLRVLLLFAALSLAGCHDSSFGNPDGTANGAQKPRTTTIAELWRLYAGGSVALDSDIVVEGVVTTADRAGNFYRTLCIEDSGAGIEIMAGIDRLHNDYPEGCRLTLKLNGLAIGQSRGMLQIGRRPAAGSGYPTDYIGSKPALDACLTRGGEALAPITPARTTIASLTAPMCGTLVTIGPLRYSPEEITPGAWAGYKRFTDDSGAEIYTFVRQYADFAATEMPAGEVTLTGIVQYDTAGDGRYIIKLRDESDCSH